MQLIGLALVFLLLGGVAYYDYTVTNQLAQRNSSLETEVRQLQDNITQLQSVLTQVQVSLLQSGTKQSLNAQQIASVQTLLQREEGELSTLASDIGSLQAGNITALALVSKQLQNLSAGFQNLEAKILPIYPAILLRTTGAALASFVEGTDEETYLRLVENGAACGVEASFASQYFNATIQGNTVEWKAVANSVAADNNHRYWPMVLENSPAGTDAIEFSDSLGVQEAAVVVNGVRTFAYVSWNSTVINTFKIVVVTPGERVDFYINGIRVASIASGAPSDAFLLMGAEVGGYGTYAPGVATLDAYGGMLGGT
jgi:hypothetical protein